MSKEKFEADLDFEKALEDLEKIVDKLEKGGLSLDKTLEEFSRGMKLLKFCHDKLDKAEKKVEIMLKEGDEFSQEKPFADEIEVD
ncbi:exodeoxyribonuclease VII small subunit [Halanaerobium sp. Z-7514]|uniref:Exodeoxyribonuclease 7 small subunit n=1 Tax=Halanaerobium polyolivorans TaxID=2886943 RepID=A0AAW4WRN4_9FIRM|nr:exodeoxyribonuclease VII small subunit [Halanaerobium polyolivorans]MCC3143773.1 exodeoxyribonuclease VII small subunit [Halanaerobium polyolivorans]RQD76970.1 MAG: exodeoxyribonuclease VII small subunit [Halanaerobium sp. MSAO_Bac5]